MEGVFKIIAVAAGGAVGAVFRYLINISPATGLFGRFPFHTFIINIVGSFVIGVMMIFFAERMEISENVRLAVIVGLLGAFTTFSTFEWELVELFQSREYLLAFGYLTLSILLGFVGVLAGVAIGRRI